MKLFLQALLIVVFAKSDTEMNDIAGKYFSSDNVFERTTIMELTNDGKFTYRIYNVGCQYEIEGTYSISKKLIHFKNDKKYTLEYIKRERDSTNIADSTFIAENPTYAEFIKKLGLPCIPDMGLIDWKIESDYIRPIREIHNCCFTENGKFKR